MKIITCIPGTLEEGRSGGRSRTQFNIPHFQRERSAWPVGKKTPPFLPPLPNLPPQMTGAALAELFPDVAFRLNMRPGLLSFKLGGNGDFAFLPLPSPTITAALKIKPCHSFLGSAASDPCIWSKGTQDKQEKNPTTKKPQPKAGLKRKEKREKKDWFGQLPYQNIQENPYTTLPFKVSELGLATE